MTVQVSDRLSQLYVGNGVNTRFDFMFRAYEQEDETGVGVRIKVGNEFEFIDETEYAVTTNPDNMGGYVTFVNPPSAETFFYIAGKTPVDQNLDITNYDNFYPDAIERALDKLTAILQEWKHLVDFETQARILADIDYDQLAIQREAELKAYIDGIASSIIGQPVVGLPAQFVIDDTENQKQINDKTIQQVKSIADLIDMKPRRDGQVVYVESYNPINYALAIPYFAKGGGFFKYDASKSSVNDGGVIINGWVRQGFSEIDVYMFGAYGNWDATAQTGNDDSVAFQKAVDFLVANGGNIRTAGNRYIKAPVGSYKLRGFTVPQGAAYFSFNMIGDGQFTSLWLDPIGGGPIDVQCENSQFKDMIINGKLTVGAPSTGDPAVSACIKGKLANKLLDVDMVLDGVSFSNCDVGARISGRGFTLKNGGAGLCNVVCEIALDSDLVVAGGSPQLHSLESSLRHFKVHDCRFDVAATIFKITGSHALKDYINGLTISDCELTLVNRLIDSADCTLVSPKLSDNVAIGCFSGVSAGMVTVPNIKDGSDDNNKWFNYIAGTFTIAQETGIRYLYRCQNIDGLTITNTTAKDIIYGVVQSTVSANNIKVINNTFPNFGNLQNGTSIIDTGAIKPTNSKILNNTFTDNGSFNKVWTTANMAGSSDILIEKNTCSNKFPAQAISYTPNIRINNANSSTATYTVRAALYWVEGDYINVRFGIAATETGTTGNVGISLPVPAVGEFVNMSSFISGSGEITTLFNFNVANSVLVAVSASSDQTAKLMVSPSTQLTLAQKTSDSIVINGGFRYRFK